jgi:MFS family permease
VRGKWWTLVGACFGLFILMLDSTAVSLALPSIRGDVGATPEQLQWVMNVYLLTIAVLVVTAGRLGDMFGRKLVFLIGFVVFALGSVVSGAAGDGNVLVLGRVLQGAGEPPPDQLHHHTHHRRFHL